MDKIDIEDMKYDNEEEDASWIRTQNNDVLVRENVMDKIRSDMRA